jgi:hypothetical protein
MQMNVGYASIKDSSYRLYQVYYACTNKRVCITVKSGKQYQGYFVGFCRGIEQLGEPYILNWHFAPKFKLIGFQESPDSEDCIIPHDDILEVEFDQNQTSLYF